MATSVTYMLGIRMQIKNLHSGNESYSHAEEKLYEEHMKNGLLFKNNKSKNNLL
jgi:hypothetical protein